MAMGMSGGLFGVLIIGAFLFLIRHLMQKMGQPVVSKKTVWQLILWAVVVVFVYNLFSPSNTLKVEAVRKPNPVVESVPHEVKEFSLKQAEDEKKERQEKFDSLTNAWREKYNQN